ncbi:hypothetical protein [Salinarimonas soli]|uniref:DUF5872 domain-containing protein n=1 Tax=Salinarimonas soli TaxID=1638099 RepID=A0A5B2VX07_9HYPH|nr:hypothetical protein [Salinarimonas soli]KAA2244363.1 hypothetical protein F0L46_00240 [Salinarimonas soli]
MAATAKKSDPTLWERVKAEITKGDKGGDPGEWSARKAQMAVQEYKRRGGGYEGRKSDDNHLVQWEHEEWGTKSGKPSGETGERYLPKDARKKLSDSEYKRTTAKKRADTRAGKQFSQQPRDIAKKAASARKTGKAAAGRERTKADLMAEARKRDVPGRSKMSKAQLERALG